MKTKLFLLVLLFAACSGFQFVVDTLQPALDASIAVSQFEDSEIPATLIRGLTRLEANIPTISFIVFVAGVFLIFSKDIRKLFDRVFQ